MQCCFFLLLASGAISLLWRAGVSSWLHLLCALCLIAITRYYYYYNVHVSTTTTTTTLTVHLQICRHRHLLNASIACLSSNGGPALLCVVMVTNPVPMIPNAQAAATAAAGALVTNATSVTYFDESNQVAATYAGSCVQYSQPPQSFHS